MFMEYWNVVFGLFSLPSATHQDDYPRNERSQNAFSFRRSSSVKKTADPDIRAKNVEELASMDCGEVCTALRDM